MKQILTDIKRKIDSNTIIVGDFNTPSRQKKKINKETLALNEILD